MCKWSSYEVSKIIFLSHAILRELHCTCSVHSNAVLAIDVCLLLQPKWFSASLTQMVRIWRYPHVRVFLVFKDDI